MIDAGIGYDQYRNVDSAGNPVFARGKGGDLTIETRRLIIRNKAFVSAETEGLGNAGKIAITTDILQLTDGSQITASTWGTGNAGDLTIDATNVSISGESPDVNGSRRFSGGLSARVNPSVTGKGGNIRLKTKTLNVSNGGIVEAATYGNGDGGSLFIKADEINVFNDPGFQPKFYTMISAGVGFDGNATLAQGKGGDLTIETRRLSVRNGAYIAADTEGIGNGGNLTIKASNIEASGRSRISADTYQIGNAGNLTITTDRLQTIDGGQISSSTFAQGNAGKLTVNASSVEIDKESPRTNNRATLPTGLFAQVETNGTGNAGDLTLTTKTLSVSNGGKVQAATFGKGNGGNLVIKAEDINVFNTPGFNNNQFTNINVGIGFDSERNVNSAQGKGGDLTIETGRLSVRNGAIISSDSKGIGIGGTLKIKAKTIELQNQGKINTETLSGQGGIINLNVSDYILMRQNSQISATAGTAQQGGDGGNITIDSKFVIATPNDNNDITANAYTGKGGNIQINAQSILGLQSRSQAPETNDITASSQFGASGTVTLNTPNLDPNRGLSVLPATTNDPSNQVNPNCSPKAIGNNSFTSVGRGGIPRTPFAPLNEEQITSNWVKLNPQDRQPSTPVATLPAQPKPIVEAQGWRRDSNGDILLVVQSSSGTSFPQPQPTSGCVDQ